MVYKRNKWLFHINNEHFFCMQILRKIERVYADAKIASTKLRQVHGLYSG